MTVHSRSDAIMSVICAVEARFDDGYRYLDHCGELISKIKARDPRWKEAVINPGVSAFQHRDKGLSIQFNSLRLAVSRAEEKPITPLAAETLVREIATEAEFLYAAMTDLFAIPNTTRLGVRYSFTANADSLEDAQRFTAVAAKSELSTMLAESFQADFYESSVQLRFDEIDTAIRRMVNIGSLAVEDKSGPMTGLKGDKADSAVSVDIDTFTRPDKGHFTDLQRLIVTSFTKSHSTAIETFDWIRKRTGT